MKKNVCLLAFILFSVYLPTVHAQEYGKLRLLQQRADHVIKKKNDFIARVLTSYNIDHELNGQGVVVRINVESQWLNVNAIEVVPILKATTDKYQQVVAHDLFFDTTNGILNVVSELTIR